MSDFSWDPRPADPPRPAPDPRVPPPPRPPYVPPGGRPSDVFAPRAEPRSQQPHATPAPTPAPPRPTPTPPRPAPRAPAGGSAIPSFITGLRNSPFLVAACVALTIATILLTILLTTKTASLEGDRDRRNEVRDISSRFATALLTLDYTNLKAARQTVHSMATAKFKKLYDRQFPTLSAALTDSQAKSTGTVVDVYVGDVDDDTAVVVVVTDSVAQTKTGTRTTEGSYLKFSLIKVGGDWKVDEATSLDFGDGPPPPTTTTTAPRTRTTRR